MVWLRRVPVARARDIFFLRISPEDVGVAFQSKFQDNDKLRKCAENDRDHLGQGVTAAENLVGDHIGLIHEALIAWALKQSPPPSIISPQEFREKRYGDSTSTLVALFKARHKPPILNFRGEIDNIVGKKTVAALDLELPPKSGGDTPPPSTQQTRVDIILKFAGALRADVTPLNVNDVLPSVRIKDYLARTDRVLVRLGQATNTIRDEAEGTIERFAQLIDTTLKEADAKGFARGKICLWGTSSGGRNVIALANKLGARGIRTDYLASLDAAFFPDESSIQPTNRFGEPDEVPSFSPPNPGARVQKSFFQRVGNHSKSTLRRGILFTSSMGGQEVHGNIVGFAPRDLTKDVQGKTPASDDDAHIFLSQLAKDEVFGDLIAKLKED
jgi:hypothetical protein